MKWLSTKLYNIKDNYKFRSEEVISGLKEEAVIDLGVPQRTRKAFEEIREKDQCHPLPLDFAVYLKFFHNEIQGQLYVK